jgi:mannosyltransferase
MNLIYDNIIYNLQKSGGISAYWYELSSRLIISSHNNVKFYEYFNPLDNIFRKKLSIPFNLINHFKNTFPLYISRYFNPRVNLNKRFIFHSSYYRISNNKHAVNILTIHDFTFEKFLRSLPSKVHIQQKKSSIKSTDGIICVSENTKKDLLNFYPEVSNKPIKVIYNGYDAKNYQLVKSSIIKNQILFVGSRVKYKNFDKVVEIASMFDDIKLIIVGSELSDNEIELLNKSLGKNRYHLLKHVSNKELNIIYSESICLLYISSYEGFGIPILEAMASGCPVISLKNSSIPEVCGNGCILLPTFDKDNIIKKIHQLRYSNEYRSNLIEQGLKNVESFSWDKCYEETINFYNQVYSRNL